MSAGFLSPGFLSYSSFTALLKAHQQISKKLCFQMYCLCDIACQFPVIGRLLELFF